MTTEQTDTGTNNSNAGIQSGAIECIVSKAVDQKFEKFPDSVSKANDVSNRAIKAVKITLVAVILIGTGLSGVLIHMVR
uniref:Uncharacterized protein n=1 Tax=Candidatus Kentrum eta TaxID=2126337 RepID=A0A450UYY8_9GAMM|nr:MAG: hypothetical protein BECKH772A_GA0070896_1012612 [Candidatus Kentron sp. H]VFJ98578.1 MAG: hypothetical protein BECKH772B_GA0070898_101379 [Candidatus Kentron sp. H]VFK03309.1 MAG: hypothetical protein BECKH772C_GA0070978_1012311 [Candidatus Kentron sp. H]